MKRQERSKSPTQSDVSAHYASGYEAERLETGAGKLDRERSRELMKRFLPAPPAAMQISCGVSKIPFSEPEKRLRSSPCGS